MKCYHENCESTSVRVPCSDVSSLPMVRILCLSMVWILLLPVVDTPKTRKVGGSIHNPPPIFLPSLSLAGQNPLPISEINFLAGNAVSLVPPRFVESKIAVWAHWLVFSEIGFAFRAIPSHGESPALSLNMMESVFSLVVLSVSSHRSHSKPSCTCSDAHSTVFVRAQTVRSDCEHCGRISRTQAQSRSGVQERRACSGKSELGS